jgi:hypothetical protein
LRALEFAALQADDPPLQSRIEVCQALLGDSLESPLSIPDLIDTSAVGGDVYSEGIMICEL